MRHAESGVPDGPAATQDGRKPSRPVFERCATLAERLSGAVPAEARGDVDALLSRWREIVAPDDPVGFERRLSWLDGAPESARRRLAAGGIDQAMTTSTGWARTWRAAARRLQATFQDDARHSTLPVELCPVDPAVPVPFEELLMPLVELAWERLGSGSRQAGHLAPAAWRDLLRSLLLELARIGSAVLFPAFSSTRAKGSNLLLAAGGRRRAGRPRRRRYERFVRQQGRHGLAPVLASHPMLARHLATRLDLWCQSAVELVGRLHADREALASTFGLDPSSRVARIRAGISDFHGGGRSVLVLTFSCGTRVVYKPRSLALHGAFNSFLAWIAASGGPRLKRLGLLLRNGYGWSEFVRPEPCATDREARRFYENAGALLCISYVLGTNDCHHENLIACGTEPVLIDTETILQAELQPERPWDEDEPAGHPTVLSDSVVRTGLLPSWRFTADRRHAYDLSGLGSHEVPACLSRMWRWAAVNTDDMRLLAGRGAVPARKNIPTLGGERLALSSYVPDLVRGFERTYGVLVDHRAELLSDSGPLSSFRGCASRFVFRPTRVYTALLRQGLGPHHGDGVAWGLCMEQLARVVAADEKRGELAPMLAAELEAMTRLDVPCFLTPVDGGGVETIGGCRLPGLRGSDAIAAARRRIERLSPEDLRLQSELIRSSCGALVSSSAVPRVAAEREDPEAETSEPLEPTVALEHARHIAGQLADRACWSGDIVHWVGLRYDPPTERLQLGLVRQGLYDGRCGIALFLATLDRVTGERRGESLWQAALRPLEADLDGGAVVRRHLERCGIGLATGAAGWIYTLTRLAVLCPEHATSLLGTARQCAALVTDEAIRRDAVLDLLGGSAGAIVALLALHRSTGERRYLEQARRAGQRLVDARAGTALQPRRERPVLAGFSHGSSGIAFALHRLFVACGDRRFDDAAREALEYEQKLFDPRERNWRDLRYASSPDGSPSFQTSWCHGAPGIALARIERLRARPDVGRRQAWTAAVETTRTTGLLSADNLCCGNLGLCETLLLSGVHENRPELRAAAESRARRVVERARATGGFRLLAGFPDAVFCPGLFQGAAGVGYQLLRLAFPQRVPSILAFE